MRYVTKILTGDGALHDDLKVAQKHAAARYADTLRNLAHQLVQIDKYVQMVEALDASLPEFRRLLELKADQDLENPEEAD